MPDIEFAGVTAVARANLYFDGKVVSHVIKFPDGSKKTLGLIYPGSFKFDTQAPEKMEITAGACRVKLAGEAAWRDTPAGTAFSVPGGSHFEISVQDGVAQYVCSYE